jgi:hypothetical protein
MRTYLRSAALPAVLLGDLVSERIAGELRDRVRPGLRPFFLADRGRYQLDDTLREPELFASLAELAAGILETELTPARARWVRMAHGDYALQKDDDRLWRGMTSHVEMVLDFSAAQSDDAQIVYSGKDGGVFWIPQQPLGGALIDRRQPVSRYDRYLTIRVGAAEVFRLSLALEVSNR